jgi:hypothetical protein
MSTLEDWHAIYKRTYDEKPGHFRGRSLQKHIGNLTSLIRDSNIETCLDYGCGPATCWTEFNLRSLWGLRKAAFFDPGVEEFAARPQVARDLVICIDVMEHIPEHLVDQVLEEIDSLTNKVAYFAISTRTSSKKLYDNVTPAHVTVKPEIWWQDKLKNMNKLVIARFES